VPGGKKMRMRVEGGEDVEVEVVVADVKLSHRRSAKPGKQPHCEYEEEEAGRCRPGGFARRFPRFSGGGGGRSVVPSGRVGMIAPGFPRELALLGKPVRPIITRVFWPGDAPGVARGWLGGGIVWGGEIPSAESVFQIFENGSRGDPSVGPCISIEILTSQGRIIGSQEIVQEPHGPPTAEGAAS
jgi:hypothetical protein